MSLCSLAGAVMLPPVTADNAAKLNALLCHVHVSRFDRVYLLYNLKFYSFQHYWINIRLIVFSAQEFIQWMFRSFQPKEYCRRIFIEDN